MAITFTHRLAGSDTVSTSPSTTASITPATDGSPIALWVATTRGTGSTPPSVTAVSGMGLTWTQMTAGTTKDAGSSAIKVGLWIGTGTASTGTVTITYGASGTGILWEFVQMAGADPTVPIIATSNRIQSSSTSAATSMSLTLPATPAVGNAVLAAVCHLAASEDITAGTNFTKGTNATMLSPGACMNWEAKTILDTTVDASWVSNVGYNGLGYEVQVSCTGTGAFAAGAAAFSGTSTETITGTGAFAAPAASFAGTGTSLLAVTGTGAFAAAAASFAGTATYTAPTGSSGGGATATPFTSDFLVTTPPAPQLLIRGLGGIQGAAASLYGVMEVGPDPSIAIRHREDEELLRLLP